jgi:hypothetical protein
MLASLEGFHLVSEDGVENQTLFGVSAVQFRLLTRLDFDMHRMRRKAPGIDDAGKCW